MGSTDSQAASEEGPCKEGPSGVPFVVLHSGLVQGPLAQEEEELSSPLEGVAPTPPYLWEGVLHFLFEKPIQRFLNHRLVDLEEGVRFSIYFGDPWEARVQGKEP